MIVCPTCQHEEFEGALFCSECGANLNVHTSDPEETLIESKEEIAQQLYTHPKRSQESVPAQVGKLALQIIDGGHILPLEESEEFTIGRISGSQPILPDIDLTPFQAYDQGVSRLHASLKIKNGKAIIIDLGSANGTRLNRRKLSPHQPYPLNHGDLLAFGKLEVSVVIRSVL